MFYDLFFPHFAVSLGRSLATFRLATGAATPLPEFPNERGAGSIDVEAAC